jgi:hypothetical protein
MAFVIVFMGQHDLYFWQILVSFRFFLPFTTSMAAKVSVLNFSF